MTNSKKTVVVDAAVLGKLIYDYANSWTHLPGQDERYFDRICAELGGLNWRESRDRDGFSTIDLDQIEEKLR